MIKINAKEMLEALKIVSPAIQKNNIIPITECVKIVAKDKKMSVIGSRINLFIIHHMEYDGGDFEILLPYFEFKKICSLSTGEITIKESKTSLHIHDGSSPYDLGTPVDVNEFPVIPSIEGSVSVSVDGQLFWGLSQAQKTVFIDQASPTGNVLLHIGKRDINVVSYNGGQAFYLSLKNSSKIEKKAILDASFISAVSDFDEAEIILSDTNICAKSDTTEVYGSLHEGNFIEYPILISKYEKTNCTLSLQQIKIALDKISVVKTVNIAYALFHLTEDTMKIAYADTAVQKAAAPELPIKNTSSVRKIIFNVDQLSVSLSQLPPETNNVNIYFTSETSLCFLTPDTDDNIKVLIQPVKVL